MLFKCKNSPISTNTDRTLSDATTLSQSGPGNDGNKEVLHIPQSFSITGTSLSDCLVSYPGHSLVRSYLSAEKQTVYSIAPADWATILVEEQTDVYIFQFFNYCFLVINWI